MREERAVLKHLPLTEATFYILLALLEKQHGYAIMQDAEVMSEGTVQLGPGTLYGALTNLEGAKLIQKAGQQGRRKIYAITELGKQVLDAQITRYEIMLSSGQEKRTSAGIKHTLEERDENI